MARFIYVEKQIVVPAGQTVKATLFQRSGERVAFLHTLGVITDSYTLSARVYVDGELFSPPIGSSTTFEIGKSRLYDKIDIKYNIEVEVKAQSTGTTSVWAYAYLEVE